MRIAKGALVDEENSTMIIVDEWIGHGEMSKIGINTINLQATAGDKIVALDTTDRATR